MSYYLKYHFDPDFDYQNLSPEKDSRGTVNHYNLGYVQTVEKGQVLAQWLELEEEAKSEIDEEEPDFTLPVGPNTGIDPKDSRKLIALTSGYVFMEKGLVRVKNTLNIRQSVDFRVGNVTLNGNIIVHGGVKSDFELQANNIVVKETVGAASLQARQSIIVDRGIKGQHRANLSAGENVQVSFVENATLVAGHKIAIDSLCMHSEIFSGDQLAVKGKLVGGEAICSRLVYVGEQLGGGMGAETFILVGYNAPVLCKIRKLEKQIQKVRNKHETLSSEYVAHPELADEFVPKIEKCTKILNALDGERKKYWNMIKAHKSLENCGVLCPGKVLPGVKICIGQACYSVVDYLEDVRFEYKDMEIIMTSPAMQSSNKNSNKAE